MREALHARLARFRKLRGISGMAFRSLPKCRFSDTAESEITGTFEVGKHIIESYMSLFSRRFFCGVTKCTLRQGSEVCTIIVKEGFLTMMVGAAFEFGRKRLV